MKQTVESKWSRLTLPMLITDVLLGCAKAAEDGAVTARDPVYGTPPPESTKRWMRINEIGPRNAPPTIVWISNTDFPRSGYEHLVLLANGEYQSVRALAYQHRCSTALEGPPAWGTLLITDFFAGNTEHLCVMPCDVGHDFLLKVLSDPSIGWTEAKAKPIRIFDAGIMAGCGKAK
jgi:hypothetical protein